MYNKSVVQDHFLSYFFVCKLIIHQKVLYDIFYGKVVKWCYTHIYEKLYSDDKSKVHHIHGEVKRDASISNNMVLGVDEYWDKEEAHKHTNYNIFKKFTQRILKETGFEYRNWIENESKKNYKQHIGTSTTFF